jgi:co-chaperonin GroES (HSP10)
MATGNREARLIAKAPTPIGDKLLLCLDVSMKTAGGIALPGALCDSGEIISLGANVPEELDLKKGQIVYLPRGDTVGDKFMIKHGDPKVEDESFLVIAASYVSCILE